MTFKDYINSEMINWLQAYNLKFKTADINLEKGALYLIFNDNYCVKIYDQLGHGFGVTVNITDNYDESIYENDRFNISWAFKYFKITDEASFESRTEKQYQKNLPYLINDLKILIPQLNLLTFQEWNEMKEWINTKTK